MNGAVFVAILIYNQTRSHLGALAEFLDNITGTMLISNQIPSTTEEAHTRLLNARTFIEIYYQETKTLLKSTPIPIYKQPTKINVKNVPPLLDLFVAIYMSGAVEEFLYEKEIDFDDVKKWFTKSLGLFSADLSKIDYNNDDKQLSEIVTITTTTIHDEKQGAVDEISREKAPTKEEIIRKLKLYATEHNLIGQNRDGLISEYGWTSAFGKKSLPSLFEQRDKIVISEVLGEFYAKKKGQNFKTRYNSLSDDETRILFALSLLFVPQQTDYGWDTDKLSDPANNFITIVNADPNLNGAKLK